MRATDTCDYDHSRQHIGVTLVALRVFRALYWHYPLVQTDDAAPKR